ncbi:hypothetical protein NQ318_018091 [Aromia moschata]|uniref:Protein kinase domain-containing protein n=1 Tax=Aromia moschata TaxID=1265417 RepID=A0AAV8ZCM3_9CUCU|nr:hypothetical protein NQ318_018091 [Aromia moschata]
MGNEQSQLPGIEIEEKAQEVSDFWSQHSANILISDNVTNLSVFIGEQFLNEPPWTSQTPLEKNSKNLMIYRHPCIIKYVSSWQKSSKFYLAVEEVTPLAHILSTLSTLQICIGLHSILKALHFLHEKALASHNNVCLASIYITKDSSWKLGGMEYLCRYKDLSCDYLNKCKSTRYSKAVDPNEDKLFKNANGRKDFVDVYAFGVLAYEVLKSKSDDEIRLLTQFREYCKNELQNTDFAQRPKFSSILDHDFFNHEFLIMHSFLVELPLKSDEEKTKFFQGLADRLRKFDEQIVANQLGGLLLSRMVLLNKTAQENIVPLLLTPRLDKDDQSDVLFSEDTYKKYISPKLLEIITVRDAQIRLLLLNHFSSFMHTFSKEELQTCILPELLVGIKDTNDHLVSVTLRTLADLVPVLGATTVIGGKRAKLFNDGRPVIHSSRRSSRTLKSHDSVQPATSALDQISLSSLGTVSNNLAELPERPRPDGEEGESTTEEIDQSADEDLDNWEDWDINENNQNPNSFNDDETINNNLRDIQAVENIPDLSAQNNLIETGSENNTQRNTQSKIIADILELDIKNQLNNDQTDDFDFFQDMEPVIDSSNKYLINENKNNTISDLDNEVNSKLAVNIKDINEEEGWGNGDWE